MDDDASSHFDQSDRKRKQDKQSMGSEQKSA